MAFLLAKTFKYSLQILRFYCDSYKKKIINLFMASRLEDMLIYRLDNSNINKTALRTKPNVRY
jgi:hypothetical protein